MRESKREKNKKAQHIYDTYLNKYVYPLIGNKTTYSNELLGAGKKLFGVKFKGVYPSDKIPKLNDLSPYCILNLDKSTESGSHWVVLAKLPYPSNDSIFYDSFGRDYKKIIPSVNYSGNGKIKNTEKDREQEFKATDCGARCLGFLLVLENKGKDTALLI